MAEGIEIGSAYVSIVPSAQGIQGRLAQELGGPAEAAGRSIGSTIVRGVAAAGIGRAIFRSFGEANEAQKIAAQTTAAIRATGSAANVTAEQVSDLAQRLSDTAAVDDDVIQSGANMLLTFKNIRNEVGTGNDVFDQATTTLLDMSVAMGTDIQSSAIQLGKALNDPVRGITALTRVGVTFTDQQKDMIRQLVETGDTLGAQKIILQELNSEFGGSAEAQATAFDRLTVASGNLKESVGAALAPAVEIAARGAEVLADGFGRLPVPIQTAVVGIGALTQVARPINDVITLLGRFGRAADVAAASTTALAAAEQIEAAASAEVVATNSAEAVSNLYVASTNAASGVSSVAAGMGVLAGTVGVGFAVAAGLEKIVNSGTRATVTIDELQHSSTRELVRTFDLAAEGLDHFGDSTSHLDYFRYIAEQSIGTARRLRDELQAQGRDVSDYDAILDQAATSQRQANADVQAGTDLLGDLGGAADLTAGQVGDLAGEIGGGASKLQQFADGLGDAVDQADPLADALDRNVTAMHDLFDSFGTVGDAEAGFRDVLRRTTTEADRLAGSNADLTERQDAFREAVEDGRDRIADYIEALVRNGATTDEAILRADALADQMFSVADQFGLTDQQANDLREELGLMPSQIDSNIRSNVGDVLNKTLLLQQALRSGWTKSSINTTVTLTSSNFKQFDSGGQVPGPVGSPLLAIVHGGEVVLNQQQQAQVNAALTAGPTPPNGRGVRDIIVHGYQYSLNELVDTLSARIGWESTMSGRAG